MNASIEQDFDTSIQLGIVPGVYTSEPYAVRWDPDKESEPQDFGWGGEDVGGVWLRQHPKTVLMQHPRLWETYDMWRHGRPEVKAEDYERLSALELAIRAVLQMAEVRRVESRREKHD